MTDVEDQIAKYIENTISPNTKRAYVSDWADFVSWCNRNQASSLPANEHDIIRYIVDSIIRLHTSSLSRRLTVIRKKHQLAGIELDWHRVELVWCGIKRTHGVRQKGKKPLLVEDIRDICRLIRNNTDGKLHRALILLGFCGAFRRSELIGLDFEDLTFNKEGLKVLIRKSKTDQSGKGREVGIPYGSRLETCPVRSVQDWLYYSGIISGPLFRTTYRIDNHQRMSSMTLTRILKKYLIEVFIQRGFLEWEAVDMVKDYSGHSLRAGFVTAAAKAGVPEHLIRKQTGHSNSNMLQRYIREADLFKENAASKIGL